MDEKDVNKAAFATNAGLFCYTNMSFGLKNAPATFQRATGVILASVKWQFAILYIDDIITFTQSPQ